MMTMRKVDIRLPKLNWAYAAHAIARVSPEVCTVRVNFTDFQEKG